MHAPAFQWSSHAEQNLGLCSPSIPILTKVLVVFKIYHALKIKYRDIVGRATDTGDFNKVHELFCELARYFINEHALHHG